MPVIAGLSRGARGKNRVATSQGSTVERRASVVRFAPEPAPGGLPRNGAADTEAPLGIWNFAFDSIRSPIRSLL